MKQEEILKSMKRLPVFLALALSALVSTQSIAKSSQENVFFYHGDWELGCDNTLSCRAAGYTENAMNSENVAVVILRRQAGPGAKVENWVLLTNNDSSMDSERKPAPEIIINKTSLGPLEKGDDVSWKMNESQYSAFMAALSNKGKITFRDSVDTYTFSSAGSNAVLLKMDEFQGRIGTQGAILSKGDRDESKVPLPKAVPVLKKMPVLDTEGHKLSPDQLNTFKKQLLPSILKGKGSDCSEDLEQEAWFAARLDADHTLIYASCWKGAYNAGNLWYTVSPDMKKIIQWVDNSNDTYRDGMIEGFFLGNSAGVSETKSQFLWNGSQFVDAYEDYRGHCAGYTNFSPCRMPLLLTKQ
ncbi:DUF1176 domain-containing protein [Pseudescherichia sp.]|uniref:DUF1176 domain-containing protein n=1 Tax=Pseudescherichia sp. TaxID=2055881 RepID=UPI0028985D61|nr:DUF1176 domain-containing protein [Pseudescherichia sp.]